MDTDRLDAAKAAAYDMNGQDRAGHIQSGDGDGELRRQGRGI
jgi:hypothetical protein